MRESNGYHVKKTQNFMDHIEQNSVKEEIHMIGHIYLSVANL